MSAPSWRCEVIKWKFLSASPEYFHMIYQNLILPTCIWSLQYELKNNPGTHCQHWEWTLFYHSQSLIFRFLTQICWCTTYTSRTFVNLKVFQRTPQKGYNWKIACIRTLLDRYYHYHYCLICMPRPLAVIKLKFYVSLLYFIKSEMKAPSS